MPSISEITVAYIQQLPTGDAEVRNDLIKAMSQAYYYMNVRSNLEGLLWPGLHVLEQTVVYEKRTPHIIDFTIDEENIFVLIQYTSHILEFHSNAIPLYFFLTESLMKDYIDNNPYEFYIPSREG